MKTMSRITPILMILVMMFPVGVLAGRKHKDMENIGNRKINGRIAGIFPNFISLEKGIQLGAQFAQFFEETARLVEDPVVTEYVDRLGQEIVKPSDAKVPFVIKVVDTEEVNAFALPGGYLYVNNGLILEADNESELARVLAHEIAHVTARHATERMSKAQLLQFATIPALFVGGGLAGVGILTQTPETAPLALHLLSSFLILSEHFPLGNTQHALGTVSRGRSTVPGLT